MLRKITLLITTLTTAALCTHAKGYLPTVFIDTPGAKAVTSRDVWTDSCAIRVTAADGTVVFSTNTAGIKGRGHSTFAKPKKPLAIRFDERTAVLGMGSGKRWVLLADFMDHSRMHNRLALALARQTGLDWTPDCRPVDVVLNGQPQGLYLLAEQVRVARGRVEIDEHEGVLLEMDRYDDGDPRFATTVRRLPVNIKSPSKPSAELIESTREFLDEIERNLYLSSENTRKVCAEYIDAGSFADWWLVHELTQNAEPNGPRSCYMHRDRDGKLKAGPVWDFDLAFIDVGLDAGGDLRPARLGLPGVPLLTADSLYCRRALWFDRLLACPAFIAVVEERWRKLEPKARSLADSIDQWAERMEPSALADDSLWQGQDPARFDTCTTFREAAANLKRTYLRRLDAFGTLLRSLREQVKVKR